MEKGFDMKMDEDVADDGWGRHRVDDEVMIFKWKILNKFPSGGLHNTHTF